MTVTDGRGEAAPAAVEPSARVVRNTGFAFASQLATSLFTAIITFYLVRTLTPREFGQFSLALALGGVLAVPSDFGVSSATARYLAGRRNDLAALAGVLADGLKLKLIASGLVSIAVFALAGPIASLYNLPGLVWPVRAIAIALFGQGLVIFYTYAFNSMGRIPRTFALVASESALEATATIALVGAGSGAAGAAFGRAIGYLVGAGLGTVLVVRVVGRLPLRGARDDERHLRGIATYAGAAVIVSAAYTLFDQIDVLLIGGLLGASQAGLFQAPLRLVTFLQYPAAALASASTPRLARGDGQSPDLELFVQAIRYVAATQALVTVPAIVWAEPIMHIVAPKYGDSVDVLRALAPFIYLSGFAVLFSLAANYLGEVRRRVPITIFTLLLNLAIDIVLLPRIGILGGAVGTDVAFAAFVPAHLWICMRFVDLPVRRLLLSIARTSAAGAALGLVMLLAGTSHLSPAGWTLGTIGGVAAFLGVLLATRELAPADLAAVGRGLRR